MASLKKLRKAFYLSLIMIICCSMNVVGQSVTELKYKTFRDKWENQDYSFYMRFDYPVSGPQVLVYNMRNWINNAIGDFCVNNSNIYYRGSLENGADLLAYYSKEFKLHTSFFYNEIRITKFFENEQVVTYLTDMLMQNADDIHTYDCATFRKSDGKMLTIHDLFDLKGDDSVTQNLLLKVWEYKGPNLFGWGLYGNDEPQPSEVDIEKISISIESSDKIRFYLKENYHGDGTIVCPVSALEGFLSSDAKIWMGK